MIQEIIVTTINEDDSCHIAPMGICGENGKIVIAPFKPSSTLENIKRNKTVTINRIDDVRIFAGCLTDHKDWELLPTEKIKGYRLESALSHVELELSSFEDDELRAYDASKSIRFRKWYHHGFYQIAEISNPLETSQVCVGLDWNQITTEVTPFDVLTGLLDNALLLNASSAGLDLWSHWSIEYSCRSR